MIPMILTCPSCCARHIDEGKFATKAHHTHACQECGMVWRPAVEATVGVRFLPGYHPSTVSQDSRADLVKEVVEKRGPRPPRVTGPQCGRMIFHEDDKGADSCTRYAGHPGDCSRVPVYGFGPGEIDPE